MQSGRNWGSIPPPIAHRQAGPCSGATMTGGPPSLEPPEAVPPPSGPPPLDGGPPPLEEPAGPPPGQWNWGVARAAAAATAADGAWAATEGATSSCLQVSCLFNCFQINISSTHPVRSELFQASRCVIGTAAAGAAAATSGGCRARRRQWPSAACACCGAAAVNSARGAAAYAAGQHRRDTRGSCRLLEEQAKPEGWVPRRCAALPRPLCQACSSSWGSACLRPRRLCSTSWHAKAPALLHPSLPSSRPAEPSGGVPALAPPGARGPAQKVPAAALPGQGGPPRHVSALGCPHAGFMGRCAVCSCVSCRALQAC